MPSIDTRARANHETTPERRQAQGCPHSHSLELDAGSVSLITYSCKLTPEQCEVTHCLAEFVVQTLSQS